MEVGMDQQLQRRRTGFWILIAVLAVSGLAMAFIALFGLFSGGAYSFVWRLFVADLYLIASLAAKHQWLRVSIWVAVGVTFVLGVTSRIVDYTQGGGYDDFFNYTEPTSFAVLLEDLEWSGHIIVGTLIALGFISFAYRWLAGEKVLRAIYFAAFGLAGAAALVSVLAVLSWGRWGLAMSDLDPLILSLWTLALTAGAIVIIGGVVQRKQIQAAGAAGFAAPAGAVPPGAGSVPAELVGGPAQGGAHAYPLPAGTVLAGQEAAELRALVRGYVDEYLAERAAADPASPVTAGAPSAPAAAFAAEPGAAFAAEPGSAAATFVPAEVPAPAAPAYAPPMQSAPQPVPQSTSEQPTIAQPTIAPTTNAQAAPAAGQGRDETLGLTEPEDA